MPTFLLKDTDAYATARKWHPGVETGLKAALVAGVSVDRSTLNMAEDGLAFTATGNPAVSPKSAVYGSAGWVDTQVAETADCTVYAIARPNAMGRGTFIGNYETNGPWGTALYMENGGVLNFHTGTYDGATSAGTRVVATLGGYAAIALADAPWRMLRVEVDSLARTATLRDLTAGTSSQQTWTSGLVRDLRSTRPMRIGAGFLSTFQASEEIMALLWYNRVLSTIEKGAVETRLKALAAYCGAAV
ncbi:hypothetical protein [Novosphingobium pituita]|uniref:Concanavalin A-like lectin/glucanase superfamily protein n=1 Tax=Novosphingobium pituita TaxID=3056842 RepID=A0ABQ6P536_9SPHN|nr:hypothetical protein [Novosphingobium sp. IK01]GMM59911.1 hypothetical protein NUTIK01_06880 [Novosphingobium sp. IK01]